VHHAGVQEAHGLLIGNVQPSRVRPASAGRTCFALIVLVVLGAVMPASVSGASTAGPPVAGEVLVGFERGATGSERAAARRGAGVTVERALRVDGVQLVKLAPGEPAEAAIARLERDPAVAFAEPNRRRTAQATLPDDPLLDRLWGMSAIHAPEAWDLETGGDTLVAVVDDGVAYDHPDLAANIWRNPGETPGNGADDDHNGLADDVVGYDFVGAGDSDPRGSGSHGTHVAGTIAAVGDNGLGVTGVSWSARLMVLRALTTSTGTDADLAEAFDYAGDMGARVVNASLGGPGYSDTLRVPITTHPDTLFVVAAGNSSADNEQGERDYPCSYTDLNLICVAATTQADDLAGYSNFGATSVDLGAPGSGIYSTVPGSPSQPAAFGSMSGTSMATPHVSGALALLLAHKPALTAAQACASVLDSGDPVSALAGKTRTGRRLNVLGALLADPPPVASTGSASSVAATEATLGGIIGSRCARTTWRFEYGPTPAYGASTPAVTSGTVDRSGPVAATIGGLEPATTYHYRLVGVRGGQRFAGADATFATADAPRDGTSTQRTETIPAPPATGDQTQPASSLATIAARVRATCARVRGTFRCRVTRASRAVRVRLVVKRRGRVVARASGLSGRRIRLRGPKARAGRYTLVITLLENGDRASATRRIKIR
jgi:subtilisin family serine protease